MSDNKLQPFKIGDTRRPTVSSAAKKSEPEAAPESYSLGFKRIEGILEKEDFESVSANLQNIRSQLDALQQQATANKDKAAAKKAAAAIERTLDLMEYLFQTKAALQSGAKDG